MRTCAITSAEISRSTIPPWGNMAKASSRYQVCDADDKSQPLRSIPLIALSIMQSPFLPLFLLIGVLSHHLAVNAEEAAMPKAVCHWLKYVAAVCTASLQRYRACRLLDNARCRENMLQSWTIVIDTKLLRNSMTVMPHPHTVSRLSWMNSCPCGEEDVTKAMRSPRRLSC